MLGACVVVINPDPFARTGSRLCLPEQKKFEWLGFERRGAKARCQKRLLGWLVKGEAPRDASRGAWWDGGGPARRPSRKREPRERELAADRSRPHLVLFSWLGLVQCRARGRRKLLVLYFSRRLACQMFRGARAVHLRFAKTAKLQKSSPKIARVKIESL